MPKPAKPASASMDSSRSIAAPCAVGSSRSRSGMSPSTSTLVAIDATITQRVTRDESFAATSFIGRPR
jgi:hypothetical protein